jgi:hypothetical protein
MSCVIEMTAMPGLFSPQAPLRLRMKTIARRLLCEMRLRPAKRCAFLRRFLKHAAMTGVPMAFPVQVPAVSP